MGGEEKSLLTFEELIRAVFGNRIGGDASNSLCFTSVATDSRNVKKDSLFIPLIGQNQDGHKFIPQALAAGASAVFVTKSVYESSPREFDSLAEKNPGVFFIAVENNLRALQDAARAYVEKFPSLIKIGITGSSGKTTTKEILSAILAQKFRVVSTVGNLNSESGLPLSVFEIRERHEAGVFEMGMNRENEIAEIASVLRPNFAIVTNVGTAHIGILKTREKIATEKKNIFSYVTESGIALFPEDDDFAEFLTEGVRGKIVRFGKNSAKNFGVKFLEDLGIGGTRFEIDGIETCLKIPGSHNFQNALSCIALAKELGLSAQEIIRGIENVKLPEGRSQVRKVRVKNGAKIFLMQDCYNANPESMKKALEFCASIKIPGRKFFVLGDMKELGERSEIEHARVGEAAARDDAKFVFFAGSEMRAAFRAAEKNCEKSSCGISIKCFSGEENFIEKICRVVLEEIRDGDFLLLKASHSMEFEKIAEGLRKVQGASLGVEGD